MTRRLARGLVADARVMTIRAVARRHRVRWHTIMALVLGWSTLVAAHRRSRRCRVLLVDETSMRRRHRYVTVLSDGETGRLLGMVPHRSAAALSGFLAEQGPRWCKGVQVVVSDGSVAYQTAINTHLGHAIHVLDRFHVARWFAVGLIQLRRQLQRRPDDEHPPTYDPELFRARFTLLRRVEHLQDGQAAQLTRLFDTYPQLQAGWEALQWLYQAYQADDLDAANQALHRFVELYATGQLPTFDQVVERIIRWDKQIRAYHHPRAARASNGRLEGLNNLLQVLRRTAHGFTNTDNFEARGLLLA